MGLGIKTKIRMTKNAFSYSMKAAKKVNNRFLHALLLCHALEKGMGITNVKKGYGQKKADELISILIEMDNMGYSHTYEFKESLAILKAYFEFHEKEKTDISQLKSKAAELLNKDSSPFCGGYSIIEHSVLTQGTKCNYEVFVSSRHSMRTYDKAPISNDMVLKAVSIAKKAPSACNREPWKFYYSLDRAKSQAIASALPAQSFLKDVSYFGVVTVDKNLFNPTEIYQWYVNGGIFLHSLVCAFHSLGIGSCIFQYPTFSKTKNELFSKIGIPENEELIAAVGFGYYPQEAKCICADRRPDQMIAKEI